MSEKLMSRKEVTKLMQELGVEMAWNSITAACRRGEIPGAAQNGYGFWEVPRKSITEFLTGPHSPGPKRGSMTKKRITYTIRIGDRFTLQDGTETVVSDLETGRIVFRNVNKENNRIELTAV